MQTLNKTHHFLQNHLCPPQKCDSVVLNPLPMVAKMSHACPLSYKRLGPSALEQIEFADAQAGQQMASQTLECPTLTTINHY
jgi:hypothetical protein